jgi:two-component sensor histidine kinase
MSLVHQKLYQSQNLSFIDLKDYFVDLSGLLLKSYSEAAQRIRLNYNMDSINVLIDLAIPCGLILNELLSNSLKHAFPAGTSGNVYIKAKQFDDGTIRLEYSDDGQSVENNFDFRGQKSLGMQSIFSIGEHQLQGKVEFESANGLHCRVEFKNSYYIPRV